MTDGFSYIGVPESKVRCIYTGDNFTDKFTVYSDRQVNGGNGVPQAVDAIWNCYERF